MRLVAIEVHTHMNDMQLRPVVLGYQGHELRTRELANTGDKARTLYLSSQVERLHVPELRGTVHGETPCPCTVAIPAQSASETRHFGDIIGMVDMHVFHAEPAR